MSWTRAQVTLACGEPRLPYDRVSLGRVIQFIPGATPARYAEAESLFTFAFRLPTGWQVTQVTDPAVQIRLYVPGATQENLDYGERTWILWDDVVFQQE